MLLISLVILMSLAYVNFFTTKKLLQPAVVFAVIWSIQLLGLLLFHDRFIEPSVDVLFIVVLGAVMFTLGSNLSSVGIIGRGHIMRPREIRRDFVLYWIAAIVVAICLYGQYKIFVDLTIGENFATSLVYARTLMTIENEDIYGLYKYGSSVALAALLLLQILIIQNKAKRVHKILFGYFLLAALFMALLTTGRGPIAFILLLLGVNYVLKVGINWRVGGVFVGILSLTFMIFWIMGRAMGKADDAVAGAVNNLIAYLFSSIPALSVYLDQHPLHIIDGDLGSNTFRFFIALMASIGLVDKPPSLVQGFVSVPNMANLYTTYLQYIKDFGLTGVVAIPLFLGFLHGHIFRWAMINKNNEFAFYILAISYLPLLQTVFQETHFLSMSSWIQFVLLGLVMTKVYKKNRGESYGQ